MAPDVTITAQDLARAQAARRWDLAFPEAIETRFEQEIGARRAKILRLAMPRTILVYNAFLLGDYFLANDTFRLAAILHLVVITPWMVVAGMMLAGLGIGIFVPNLQAYVSGKLPYTLRARGLGMIEYSWALTGIILSLIHISEPTRPY